MNRKSFLKTVFGSSLIVSMDGFSSLINMMSNNNHHTNENTEIARFGAVHLTNTSLERAVNFWTKIVGMKQRHATSDLVEFGTEVQTLVVVHLLAQKPYAEGYSGLYHFAIHAPNKQEFAKMLYRLMANNYPCSPTDHTMSKSVYLNDFDGITLEFALETPERFKRVITDGGLRVEATDGSIRSASARLDIDEVLLDLQDKDTSTILSDETRIGHIHLYANNVEKSNAFYKQLGFSQFNYLPQFMYADVGAGGAYRHRVALNSWHGANRPLAPKENAGLHYFQIIFDTHERLLQALKNISAYEEKDGAYWVNDPTGNLLKLTY